MRWRASAMGTAGLLLALVGCSSDPPAATGVDDGGAIRTLPDGAPIGPPSGGADASHPSGDEDAGGAVGCTYDAGAIVPPGSGDGAGSPADKLVSVTPAGASVELYHPLVLQVATGASFKNGFDPDEVAVDVRLTGPCGEAIVQPCFYKATANGEAAWECRFAPRHLGDYSYRVALKEAGGTAVSAPLTLTATSTTSDGFLHADTAHATAGSASSDFNFRFDSGKLWRGVGENVAWEIDNYKFPVAIPRLHADGLNMMRIWHSSWSLPIEWGSGPNHYNQDSAKYFDQIVSLAEQNGVYMMVTLADYRDYHEHWGDNVYNKANGGWCNQGGEFFSNADAKATYKKKLRYYVARWGYSPAIHSFELWNEIDNAMLEDNSIHAEDLVTWIAEMSDYLRSIDPYEHLRTASVSYVNLEFWKAPGIDFTQAHLYGPNNRIAKLQTQMQSYVGNFKKPYVCGEFSKRWEAANSEASANYRQELHYGMWLGMVQSTPILPMTWWWDSHWNWGDDFVFKSIAGFSNDLVEKAGNGTVASIKTAATGNLESGGLATGKTSYVWVSNYNPGKGTVSDVTLTLSGLRAGSNAYTVEPYDTWSGGFSAASNVTSNGGALTIHVGTLGTTGQGSDAAYRVVDVNAP